MIAQSIRWLSLSIWTGVLTLSLNAFSPEAQALVININAVGGGGLDIGANSAAAMAAFNRAADRWEVQLTDDVTVQIKANVLDLGNTRVIGRAGSTMLTGSFNTIRNAIAADGSNEEGDAITAALPNRAQFNALAPSRIGFTNSMALTQANAMALGFGRVTASDATIEFNSGFSFDYDNRDGVTGMDFESVAMHEIGHALGFISVVDQIDSMVANGQRGNVSVTPLDLFRFGTSANPTTTAQFTTFKRELRPGAVAFFDDLTTELGLSTGYYTGDKRQASHWRDDSLSGLLLGAMDPTLSYNFILPLTENDKRVLDLIGWEYGGTGGGSGSGSNLIVSAASTTRLYAEVSEPEVIALLLAGLLGINLTRQKKTMPNI